MPTNIKELLINNQFLTNQNANYRSYTQDLADFVLPRKAWINSIRTKGERVKFNFLYDSTAIRALRNMASGFNSNLTSQSTRWFALETLNKDLMESLEVREWFKNVENNLFATLHKSNFYNIIQEFFIDYGGFGTGTFLMLEDPKDDVRFTSIPVQQVNRVEDANGRLSEMYRNFKLTASQAMGMWGDDSGKLVRECVEKKPYTEFDFLHYVGPRHDIDVSKSDAVNMPFKSVWVEVKGEHTIGESGFKEMPYMSDVFYRDSSDPNGFSPTMDVFADIKLVNAMKRTVIRAGMKQADPPYMMPSRGFMLPLNLNPAGMNYRDAKTNKDDLQPLPVGGGSMAVSKDLIQMVQDDIRDGMFVTLFRSLNEITKQMTIPEIQRRVADNMTLLGPVVGRVTHGILDKMIERLFNIQMRNDRLPPPPEALMDQDFTMVYLSPLAKAQKSTEVAEIQSYLADVQAIASILPSALDKIDEDKTVDVLARMRGITPELMRGEEEVARMRQHRAEQDAMVQQLQMGQGAASMAKDGAQAQAMSEGE